jgi:cold shock CspA family protein
MIDLSIKYHSNLAASGHQVPTHPAQKLLCHNNLIAGPISPSFDRVDAFLQFHSNTFGIGFNSFVVKARSMLACAKHSVCSSLFKRFAQNNSHHITEILEHGNLSSFSALIFLLAHSLNMRVKLFEILESRLNVQHFGARKDRVVLLLKYESTVSNIYALGSVQLNETLFDLLTYKNHQSRTAFKNHEHLDFTPDKANDDFDDKLTSIELTSRSNSELSGKIYLGMLDFSDNDSMSDDPGFRSPIKSSLSPDSHLKSPSPISWLLPTEENPALSPVPSGNIPVFSRPKTSCIPDSFKSKVIQEEEVYSTGKIKFYLEQNDYGFIACDDGRDIFVHRDDLIRAGIAIEQLSQCVKIYEMRVQFRCIQYQGKTKISNKAVDVQVVELLPLYSH